VSSSSDNDSLGQFARELYRSPGVADACLELQSRHELDVNIVLFAAFAGAVKREVLTDTDLGLVHDRVDAWHQEVVRPLRAVRQRLRSGPPPAPDETTAALRRKLAQLEIEAEMIELRQLGTLSGQARPAGEATSAVDCATAAIKAVVTAHTHSALVSADRRAIGTIAAQAVHVTAPPAGSGG
jgi:uncharacterized protein (TIGR02444 family)